VRAFESALLLSLLGQFLFLIAAERQGSEHEKSEAGGDVNRARGQEVEQTSGDGCDHGLDKKRQPSAGDHVAHAKSSRKNKRRKRGLVRQLGDEDYSESRENGGEQEEPPGQPKAYGRYAGRQVRIDSGRQGGVVSISSERRKVGRLFGIRNIEGGMFVERFLVSGVASLLLLRFYLELTGFPQIGGNGLHIAHLLWGGLLMLVALVLLMAFLGESLRGFAAIVGGIGFGLFIDEIGKFVTTDNNYFFRPAIALIYVIFIILYMVARVIDSTLPHTEQSYLANALNLMSDGILRGYDRSDHERAMKLLDNVSEQNPVRKALRDALSDIAVAPDPTPGRLVRVFRAVRDRYYRLVKAPWFWKFVLAGFVIYAILSVIALLIVVAALIHEPLRRAGVSIKGDIGFSSLTDLLIVAGVIAFWARSRLDALLWFKRAMIVSILLAQPFLFYTDQLAALAWLILDLVLLETLNFMIDAERKRSDREVHASGAAALAAGKA
jgi:hypothetical protein